MEDLSSYSLSFHINKSRQFLFPILLIHSYSIIHLSTPRALPGPAPLLLSIGAVTMVNTRSTESRLDGLEKAVGDLEKQTGTLTSMVDELNIQCSGIGTKLDDLMAEIRATLAAGSTSTPKQPILTTPPSGSGPTSATNSTLTMPTFDGTDALSWLTRAEQYFLVAGTLPENRLDVAMVALAGPALPWFQLLHRRLPTLTWDHLKLEIMKRFGDKMALDGYEAFASTRQEGSLTDFVTAFEARLVQIPDLADHQYLGFFLAALRPEIRMHMKAANITSYSDAVQMALQLDQLSGSQPIPTPTPPLVSPAQPVQRFSSKPFPSPSGPVSTPGPRRSSDRRFRQVSAEEYKKHMAAGTCIRCGLKYSPSHRCPPKTLNVFVLDDDEPISDTEEEAHRTEEVSLELHLSELSFNGLDATDTMKLYGHIGHNKVLIMVDSGASPCFISAALADSLQLPVTPTAAYSVTLGDESKVRSSGICQGVPLRLASAEFMVSCYVFSLRSIDVILGVSWLKTLGDVTANWERSSMKFNVQGRIVTIGGDPTLTRRACSAAAITHLDAGDAGWVLRSMSTADPSPEFGFDPSLPPAARDQLQALVEDFPAASRPIESLPPHR